MTKIKLNLKDRKILYQLDLNSRQSNSEIAKKVQLSKDIVNYRIKRLENLGIINGYYTIINFLSLGYLSIRVYLKLFDATPEKEKEIINYLVNNPKVFYLARTDGHIDLAFGTYIKNNYEFEDFYLNFKKKFKECIGQEQISIFTRAHHFHRDYLLNKKFKESKVELASGENIVSCDKLDIEILKLLAGNSRIPTLEISKRLNTPPRTIAFRIKQLEKKKIIQAYRFIFDFSLLGYKYYKTDLILKNLSRIKEIINYAYANPNIAYINETIAGSDFEFDIEIKSKEKFIKLIEELRTKFPEIRTWSYFTVREYKKLIYFPED